MKRPLQKGERASWYRSAFGRTDKKGPRGAHDTGHCGEACWYCMRDLPRRKMPNRVGFEDIKRAYAADVAETSEMNSLEGFFD